MQKQYVVYNNDLKFKNKREINSKLAIWYSDTTKTDFETANYDTLRFRLNECKANNFTYLDLSHLELSTIPNLIEHKHYAKLRKVKHLFINNNNLTSLLNLDQFDSVEVLDVSTNKITILENLPQTIVELCCHDNLIESLPLHINIMRLDITHNNVRSIGKYDKLERLLCESNKIEYIASCPRLKWITCKNNPLRKLYVQPMLEYLDCSNTNMHETLTEFYSLKHFMCNNTRITEISPTLKLQSLEIVGTPITILPYIKTLKDFIYSKNLPPNIDERYNVSRFFKEHDKVNIEFVV
jgi:hypothetical protein